MSLAVIWPILLGLFIGWGCVAAALRLYRFGIARAMWAREKQAARLDGSALQLANARWGRG